MGTIWGVSSSHGDVQYAIDQARAAAIVDTRKDACLTSIGEYNKLLVDFQLLVGQFDSMAQPERLEAADLVLASYHSASRSLGMWRILSGNPTALDPIRLSIFDLIFMDTLTLRALSHAPILANGSAVAEAPRSSQQSPTAREAFENIPKIREKIELLAPLCRKDAEIDQQ